VRGRVGIRWGVRALSLAGALAIVGAVAFACQGISARSEPSALEARLARFVRDVLIPADARRRTNPLAANPALLERAEEHFSDHCAFCHGPAGRGDTEIGRALHPRAPDLTRAATRALSDGELFWIIENGIRMTGMPGFGTKGPDDDEHAWALVHWIRRLHELGPDELEREGADPSTGRGMHEHTHHRQRWPRDPRRAAP
jgi:mono/diheme cytochrome c family protein